MINNISSSLIKEALQHDTLLPQELYDVLKMIPEDKESGLSELINFHIAQTKSNTTEKESDYKDFRFKHILIKNFRLYGEYNDNDYFGIQTTDNNKQPKNLILLGDNGSGKSSIFDAIEYWAVRNISEAEYRDIEDQEWYYLHNEKKPNIQIITNEEKIIGLDSEDIWQSHYDVSRFFISENSILETASFMNENGEKGRNWYRFFCYMLGIDPFLIEFAFDNEEDKIYNQIERILSTFKSETQDFKTIERELERIHNQIIDDSIFLTEGEINSLRKKQEEFRELLITWDKKLDNSNFENEISSVISSSFNHIPAIYSFNLLCNDIKDRFNKLSPTDENYSKSIFLKKDENSAYEFNSFKKELLDAVTVCLQRLGTILDKNIQYDNIIQRKNKLLQIQQLKGKIDAVQLETLLVRLRTFRASLAEAIKKHIKLFIDLRFKKAIDSVFDETFINEQEQFNFNIDDIDKNIISIEVNDIPIHKYFNTFRYRLFCLSMQVMINLKMMEYYNFSFPIIFDDVFYANDYKNKQQLYKFFEYLTSKADIFLTADKRLQIIFLTHDELLVATLHKKFKESFSFGRMINISEFKDPATQEDLIISPNTEFKYLNLYFSIYEPLCKIH